jgi:hypothetical protein
MAYGTPELLLVGAAQDLVLGDSFESGAGLKQGVNECRGDETIPPNDLYDLNTLW